MYLKVEELNGQIKKQETTESRTIRSIEPEPQATKSYPGRNIDSLRDLKWLIG